MKNWNIIIRVILTFFLVFKGMVWMGLFMAPGLPAINLVKLAIIMYVRGWAVMTTNVPHETVFKAGSNNFYFVLLLIMLFLCTLPVSFELILDQILLGFISCITV